MKKLISLIGKSTFDSRVNQRNITYFYVAATEQNFTRAAQICDVSQPSLSRGISQLEDAIGVPLFDRVGRNVQLTGRGTELLPIAETYLNHWADFSEWLDTSNVEGKSEITLATISTLTGEVLPRLLESFEQQEPLVSVKLTDGNNTEVIDAVAAGDADLGIVFTPRKLAALEVVPLFTDNYILAVGRGHRYFDRKKVRWDELAGEKLATFHVVGNNYVAIEQTLAANGVDFSPEVYVKFRSTMMGLVKHRGMSSILPSMAIQELPESDIRAIPLVAPVLERPYYLAFRKGRKDVVGIDKLTRFLANNIASSNI